MRVVLLEPPPSGQRESSAASLAEALAVPRISLGDLMRAHISQGTELGTQSAEMINSGRLLPDALITAVVGDYVVRATDAGFLLEGHPRSAAQALALDELLRELGQPLDCVFYLRLAEEELERRVLSLTGRRVCREDGTHVFEPSQEPYVVPAACGVCGGELYQRAVDGDNSVRGRFRSFEAMQEPIAQHYARQDLLVTVEVVGSPHDVAARALAALREHRR
ncbi:adenylate kinase family protein [Streptacidiphilus fuscans]|uniref:Adenylate kinase n=1 Tax=Streptacidiphilus fuscans TaxID=2789292 RepID=A0A931FD25_9ACTN|nr:nucleoside monophosphate kinase [Streptacidiphilus fuscans]MBF9067101.1 nucleoside monophosphate kinase [Streptacidiphilus fuscans]